jgi:hypothetical protein
VHADTQQQFPAPVKVVKPNFHSKQASKGMQYHKYA